MIHKIAFNESNHEVGTSNEPIVQFAAAVSPAQWNNTGRDARYQNIQNIIENSETSIIAKILFFSSFVSGTFSLFLTSSGSAFSLILNGFLPTLPKFL